MMREKSITLLVNAVAVLLLVCFVWILGDVVIHGFEKVDLPFIFSSPENSGRAGGIWPIIVSTFYILLIAVTVAVPIGLCVAIWLSEYTRQDTRRAHTIRVTLDVLAGVPSIVYGLFGNAFFCLYLGLGFSILSGGLTLACMILPIFIRTSELGLSLVNKDWRFGALALGMTRYATVLHIILPAAIPAIVAGLILSVGRATAETAALIFTSGYVDRLPESIMDSGRALAVHVYDLSMNVTGGDSAAYGTALVLVAMILIMNAGAQLFVDRWMVAKLKA